MKKLLTILFVCLVTTLSAQSAKQIDFLLNGVHDANGSPIQNGKAYFYETGHIGDASYYKPTWADAYKVATNTNPVTLNSLGNANVFADGTYDVIVKDEEGTTLIQVLAASYGAEGGTGVGRLAAIEEYLISITATDPIIYLSNPYNIGQRQLQVFLDGVRQYPSEILEINSTRFKLLGVVTAGSRVQVYNLGTSGEIGYAPESFEYITASSTLSDPIFTLTATYTPNLRGLVPWVDGIRQYPTEFTEISESQVQISGTIASGSIMMFEILK